MSSENDTSNGEEISSREEELEEPVREPARPGSSTTPIDFIRVNVFYALVALFGGTLILIFLGSFMKFDANSPIWDILKMAISGEIALLGTAFGYFFQKR